MNDPVISLLVKEELLRSHGIGHTEIMKMSITEFEARAMVLGLPMLQKMSMF